MTFERFLLDDIHAQCDEWLGKLKRGVPVTTLSGRNITQEYERANTKLRETGGLAREATPRDRYGWRSG